jgi:hypothetical protein
MLMPTHLTAGEEQPWCKEAELMLLMIITETPIVELFQRVDIETGRPVGDTPKVA